DLSGIAVDGRADGITWRHAVVTPVAHHPAHPPPGQHTPEDGKNACCHELLSMSARKRRSDMYERTIALTLGLLVATALTPAVMAQGGPPAITEQEAHAIGVDAYLYFYPLISMDVTRKQSTNIEPGKEFAKGPMNMFVNVPAFPPADLKVVVRVNF